MRGVVAVEKLLTGRVILETYSFCSRGTFRDYVLKKCQENYWVEIFTMVSLFFIENRGRIRPPLT